MNMYYKLFNQNKGFLSNFTFAVSDRSVFPQPTTQQGTQARDAGGEIQG